MPVQKPGRSKQDYQTPPEFLAAVKKLLEIDFFDVDLAASVNNSVAGPNYYSEENSALDEKNSWNIGGGWAWCNPPYGTIKPWVQKALEESKKGARIAMLVPASVGSNWWRDYVDAMANVLFLNGRLTFKGHTAPYPKDCALLMYGPVPDNSGSYSVWNWRSDA